MLDLLADLMSFHLPHSEMETWANTESTTLLMLIYTILLMHHNSQINHKCQWHWLKFLTPTDQLMRETPKEELMTANMLSNIHTLKHTLELFNLKRCLGNWEMNHISGSAYQFSEPWDSSSDNYKPLNKQNVWYVIWTVCITRIFMILSNI